MQRTRLKTQDKKTSDTFAITSARIANFRGFSDVKLDDIRRINILVGDNGSGKTAFLEALFLVTSNSLEEVLVMRQGRGLPTGGKTSSEDNVWEFLLGDFFRNFNKNQNVELSIKGNNNYKRKLRIFRKFKLTLVPIDNANGAPGSVQSPISFEWTKGNQRKGQIITPEVDEKRGTLVIPHASESNIKGKIFLPNTIASPNPEEFSNLRKAGKDKEFLEEIKKQFPDIEDMSVEIMHGNSMVYAKRKSEEKLMPINLLSNELCKIFNILLNFTALDDHLDFLFVDELDTGIHFQRHELFWRQINELSRKHGTQLFASVHSREFLDAVLPVARKHPEDFSIIRTYQEGNVGKAAIVSGSKTISLIESGLEFRL